MRQIEPVNIWLNGEIISANKLSMYVVIDDLKTYATFHYQLLNAITSQSIASGTLTMSGQAYNDWGSVTDINDEAYIWAANELNLTLI